MSRNVDEIKTRTTRSLVADGAVLPVGGMFDERGVTFSLIMMFSYCNICLRQSEGSPAQVDVNKMKLSFLTTLPQFWKYHFDQVASLCVHIVEGGGDEDADCFPYH
jgi:hypothetical protein